MGKKIINQIKYFICVDYVLLLIFQSENHSYTLRQSTLGPEEETLFAFGWRDYRTSKTLLRRTSETPKEHLPEAFERGFLTAHVRRLQVFEYFEPCPVSIQTES